jgi:TonB family protein
MFNQTLVAHIACLKTIRSVIPVILLVLGFPPPWVRAISSPPKPALIPTTQVAVGWQWLSEEDEEFSMRTPVQPSIKFQLRPRTYVEDGERVLAYRAYSGFQDDFIFVVESYKASKPKRLLKDMNEVFKHLKFLEETSISGFIGKKYEIGEKYFRGYLYSFLTAKHLYILTVAARDANHPSIAQFVSSFTLGSDNASLGKIRPRREDRSLSSDDEKASAVPSKELTQKQVVVWKPEPNYTQDAIANQRIGKVILKAVCNPSGRIVITKVIQGLKDGLTEEAIEAAKNIKFFPGLKDGKPVPVQIQLEYNFNLY